MRANAVWGNAFLSAMTEWPRPAFRILGNRRCKPTQWRYQSTSDTSPLLENIKVSRGAKSVNPAITWPSWSACCFCLHTQAKIFQQLVGISLQLWGQFNHLYSHAEQSLFYIFRKLISWLSIHQSHQFPSYSSEWSSRNS